MKFPDEATPKTTKEHTNHSAGSLLLVLLVVLLVTSWICALVFAYLFLRVKRVKATSSWEFRDLTDDIMLDDPTHAQPTVTNSSGDRANASAAIAGPAYRLAMHPLNRSPQPPSAAHANAYLDDSGSALGRRAARTPRAGPPPTPDYDCTYDVDVSTYYSDALTPPPVSTPAGAGVPVGQQRQQLRADVAALASGSGTQAARAEDHSFASSPIYADPYDIRDLPVPPLPVNGVAAAGRSTGPGASGEQRTGGRPPNAPASRQAAQGQGTLDGDDTERHYASVIKLM